MASLVGEPSATGTRDVAASTAVLEAVSSDADTPAADLPALTDVIDPDALDGLFPDADVDGRVEFGYAGRVVTVHADGTVDVSGAD